MANIVNMTPHEVNLGGTVVPPSGQVARVSTSHEKVGEVSGIPIYRAVFGEVTGLPEQIEGTIFLVSGMVAAAVPDRPDVFSPATGHPDVVRVAGQVTSVPGVVCTPAY